MTSQRIVPYNLETVAMADIMGNHGLLVKRIAYHLIARLPACIQVDDLIQAGMIGLLEAAKNFDDSKGASFETYAGIRIRGTMLDEIRKGDWAPRSVYRNTRKITKAIREIENKTGRDARDFEVAEHLNITLENYHSMLQDTSGIKIFGFDDIGINIDTHADNITTTNSNLLEGLAREDFKKNLAHIIADMPDREQLVLALYYEEELNLKEVGVVLGVSESRVSQIHSQAMLRLQARVKERNII